MRRKDRRLVQLHTQLIPVLRLGGYLLQALGLLLHDWILPGSTSPENVLAFLVVSLSYCAVSWLLLLRFYRPRSRFDLGLTFLVLDLPFFTSLVYLSGGEASWLFFILLARVADQTTAGFRRALLFAHLAPLAYAAMLAYIVLVDGRPISPGFALAMLIFLYGAGVYISLTARPNDRRRRRAAEAVTIGRELIAQLRRQSEELAQAKSRAEAASVAKSRFLNNSSHELRTPLNGILGLLQMLLGSELRKEQEELVGAAQSGAEKLLGTLDDIIDYSALEDTAGVSQIVPLEASRIDVPLLLGSSLERVRQEAEEKEITLTYRIAPGTPQSFFSDPQSLRRILVNLVSNAVKFSESGEVEVSVQRRGQAALRFEVKDCGAGIPEEERELIFQPFTQVDASVRRRHSGTGLGLALSRALVERLGGEIGVEPRLGGGSVFWFTVEDHRMGTTQEVDEREGLIPPDTRVLIVEDDLINQKITYHQLLSLGVQAEVANNGAEALERLAESPFDLVLMDIQMPELDGYAATRELRQREGAGARTPVVALTAHALPSDRRQCLEAGMDEHLSKPVSTEVLRSVILRWIPSEPEEGGHPLQPATIQRVRELGERHGRKLLQEMAQIFLREVPLRVERLGEALSQEDRDEALYLAHSIKGSCISLGVQDLGRLSRTMEERLRARNLEEAATIFPAVQEALRRARGPLQELTE